MTEFDVEEYELNLNIFRWKERLHPRGFGGQFVEVPDGIGHGGDIVNIIARKEREANQVKRMKVEHKQYKLPQGEKFKSWGKYEAHDTDGEFLGDLSYQNMISGHTYIDFIDAPDHVAIDLTKRFMKDHPNAKVTADYDAVPKVSRDMLNPGIEYPTETRNGDQIRPWGKGAFGKGFTDDKGNSVVWKVNAEGSPHHFEVLESWPSEYFLDPILVARDGNYVNANYNQLAFHPGAIPEGATAETGTGPRIPPGTELGDREEPGIRIATWARENGWTAEIAGITAQDEWMDELDDTDPFVLEPVSGEYIPGTSNIMRLKYHGGPNHDVMGYVDFDVGDTENPSQYGEIKGLEVEPKNQRMGVATDLMDKLHEMFPDTQWDTEDFSEEGKAFNDSLGDKAIPYTYDNQGWKDDPNYDVPKTEIPIHKIDKHDSGYDSGSIPIAYDKKTSTLYVGDADMEHWEIVADTLGIDHPIERDADFLRGYVHIADPDKGQNTHELELTQDWLFEGGLPDDIKGKITRSLHEGLHLDAPLLTDQDKPKMRAVPKVKEFDTPIPVSVVGQWKPVENNRTVALYDMLNDEIYAGGGMHSVLYHNMEDTGKTLGQWGDMLQFSLGKTDDYYTVHTNPYELERSGIQMKTITEIIKSMEKAFDVELEYDSLVN